MNDSRVLHGERFVASIQPVAKDIREVLGLTQEKLASCLKVSLPTIRRWETGRSHPDALALHSIQEFLRSAGPRGSALLARHFPERDTVRPSPRRRGRRPSREGGSGEEGTIRGEKDAPKLKGSILPTEHRDVQVIFDELTDLDAEASRLDTELREIFARLHQHLEVASARAQRLQALLSSLLHRLMTGEIRVPTDLIERSRAQPRAMQAVSATSGQSPGGPREPDEASLQEIVRRIVAAVAPARIVLFGSAARGEMGPDSDLDLLVVKACERRREVARTVRACLRGVEPGRGKDVVVVTPEDVERDRDTIGYIIRPALREGRVLYAP